MFVLKCCRPASVLQSGGCHQVAIRAILSDHTLASLNLRIKVRFYFKVASCTNIVFLPVTLRTLDILCWVHY